MSDLIAGRTIKTKPTGSVLVDEDVYAWASKYSWWLDPKGYAFRSTKVSGKNKSLRLHRVILGAITGQVVDHINGDKTDNRKVNLRFSTMTGNACNRRKLRPAKSVYKGVDSHGGRYYARIGLANKIISLGGFSTEIEAARAYDEAAKKLHGEFAHLNFRLKEAVSGEGE